MRILSCRTLLVLVVAIYASSDAKYIYDGNTIENLADPPAPLAEAGDGLPEAQPEDVATDDVDRGTGSNFMTNPELDGKATVPVTPLGEVAETQAGTREGWDSSVGLNATVTLSAPGSTTCTSPFTIASQVECLAKGLAAIPSDASPGRVALQTGSWGHVPPGCSVQSGGDWAVHFNTNAASTGNSGEYSPVCVAGDQFPPSWMPCKDCVDKACSGNAAALNHCEGKPGGWCWPLGPVVNGIQRCGILTNTRTAACAAKTVSIVPTGTPLQHVYGKSLCAGESDQDADCAQDPNIAAGYWDFTDYVLGTVCGSWMPWGMEAFEKFGFLSITGLGNSADFSYEGRVTDWAGKSGDFTVIKITGKPLLGTVDCQMESGMQLWVCNQAAADGSCGCTNKEIVKMDAGHRLITPTNKAQAKQHCGAWFTAVQTVVGQVFAQLRFEVMNGNPKASKWVKGESVTE
jgi:hypothetical protein